jgi:D-threonate/D-erythronate kinase
VGPTCVIVADDVTGAADASAPFVVQGWSGVVAFGWTGGTPVGDVLALSTDSRALRATRAAERVRELVWHTTRAYTPALVFKKIDSTLRGHVGPEVVAAMDASGARVAIVAPAFPAMGRTVEKGLLCVTGAGALPPCDVVARLEAQGVRECRRIPWHDGDQDERTTGGWRGAIAHAVARGARVLVCDSVSNADLDDIVDAASVLEESVLWVGSAGLAGALARRMTSNLPRDARCRALGPPLTTWMDAPSRSVVLWIGSNHPATEHQRRHLLTRQDPVVSVAADEIDRAAAALDRGAHVLVHVKHGVHHEAIDRLIRVLADQPVAGFVMSGGDTALRVCRTLEATMVEVGGEVSPGMPWGSLLTRSGRRWPTVLKSGGFGSEHALSDAIDFLAKR